MPGIFAFCRCVGEAVLARGARGLAGLAPFGDHLYDIAADALKRWRDRQQAEDQQQALRQEFEQAAQAKLEDFEHDMRRIVAFVSPQRANNGPS